MAESIAILGGTFDPVHVGHMSVAAGVRDRLGAQRVLMVVANDPWKKWGRDTAPALDRLEMVKLAIAGMESVEASDIEIRRGGVSFTTDTLEELHGECPSANLLLVVGADLADELGTWERFDRIGELAELVVVARPGSRVPELAKVLEFETPDVSSTEIRARIGRGEPIEGLVPKSVSDYISARGLYIPGGAHL